MEESCLRVLEISEYTPRYQTGETDGSLWAEYPQVLGEMDTAGHSSVTQQQSKTTGVVEDRSSANKMLVDEVLAPWLLWKDVIGFFD